MSASAHAPEPGTILAGKYRVEQVLGVGGMGAVVAAHHLQLDQKVAIKYLLPEALKNPEVVARFAREARAAAKIRGEHVARIIDVGQFEDGAPYMVMEHLEGRDLAKELDTAGPIGFEDLARYILETCEALAEAHAAKIVHRDLKPSNLFLAKQPDKRSIVKVLDFGISKVGDSPAGGLTSTSALMGTAFYMSPEQMTAPKTVDARSDIWALGVIMYELLGGRPPFLGETVPEVIGSILMNEPDPLTSLRPDVPAGLEAVVARCLQSKAAQRYENVAALAEALAPFAAPRDRGSVEVISRVLGDSLRPPRTLESAVAPSTAVDKEKETLILSARAASRVEDRSAGAPSLGHDDVVAPTLAAMGMPRAHTAASEGGALGAHPTTAIGLSTSVAGVPRRSTLPIFLVVGLGLAIGVGVFAYKSRAAEVSPTGIVTTPATTAPLATTPLPSASAAAIEPSTTATTSAPHDTPPATPPVHATAQVPPAPPTTHKTTPPRPTVAAASISAPPPATAPSAPPASTAAASSSAGKNPLQMGIK